MVSLEPTDPWGHFFASLAAGNDGRFDEADAGLERAHALGLPDPLYQETRTVFDDARPRGPVYLRWAGLTLAGWFAVFGVLFVAGSFLSASAIRASRRMPGPGDGGHPVGLEAFLRRAYRVVLWISCGFYYVSLPLLAAFLIIAAVGVGYATLLVGHVPIKLLLIVGVIVISSLVAIVRSLLIRGRDEDPGERIDLAEHPRMRAVLDEVAERIGTRPVDHVYLTPFTDIAVLERGGLSRQLRGTTERALVLGAGVLDGMKLRAFKGILAHEYGHFHNEDTAGGGFALAVRRSVLTMAMGLAQRGAASALNPAWWFVNGFYSVFLRISHGASRLQEVLADRWAAFAYGSAAFEEGMRHVVRRSLAFDAHADRTLAEVVEHKRALANLYGYAPELQGTEDDVEKAFDEAWNATPSPYDSHPRPADRIAWVRALEAEGGGASPGDDDDAWMLFADRAQVEKQMTDLVRIRVAMATGVQLADA
jgi:Zn-dependent protease with chaperone function